MYSKLYALYSYQRKNISCVDESILAPEYSGIDDIATVNIPIYRQLWTDLCKVCWILSL